MRHVECSAALLASRATGLRRGLGLRRLLRREQLLQRDAERPLGGELADAEGIREPGARRVALVLLPRDRRPDLDRDGWLGRSGAVARGRPEDDRRLGVVEALRRI